MLSSVSDLDLVHSRMQATSPSTHRLKTTEQQQLMEACRDFESIFVKQMIDSMSNTVNKSGLIKESRGEEIFKDMLNQEYAQIMSRTSGLGIAEMIYRQMVDRMDAPVFPGIDETA